MDNGVAKCSSCKGPNNCDEYCPLHTGKAVANYVHNIDVTESRIGETSQSTKYGPIDIVVAGHQMWDLGKPSWIYKKIDAGCTKYVPILTPNNCEGTPAELLKEYVKIMGIDFHTRQQLEIKLKCIQNRKMLILPFKPHMKMGLCLISGGEDKRSRIVVAEIHRLRWDTDVEKKDLVCTVTFANFEGARSIQEDSFELGEYCQKFGVVRSSDWRKAPGIGKGIIKMDSNGVIRPLKIVDESIALIFDGTYMYLEKEGKCFICGKWKANDNSLELNNELLTPYLFNNAYTYFKEVVKTIAEHRVYMAPYKLYECNEVSTIKRKRS